MLRSECVDQQIVGLGLNNIIAIAMSDALLIVEKNRVKDFKKVLEHLKLKNIQRPEGHPKDFRPWRWFESFKLDDCFQIKRIFVNPGAAISFQRHKYGSELWIVVDDTAKVRIGHEIKLVNVGYSVYVPKGVIHRMENPVKSPIVLIEVQIGNYLGEDDIKRYEDLYSRQ